MPTRGPLYYVKNTGTDSPPTTNVCDLNETATISPATQTGTMTGSTSAATIFQLFPQQSIGTLQNATAANTGLANNKGWWIPPTGGMAGTSTDLRVLAAGTTITTECTVTCTGLSGNNTVTMRAYKRSAAGALTSINSGSSTAPNGALGTTTQVFPATSVPSDQTFDTGETLYVELYVTVAQQSITAGTCTAKLTGSWSIAPSTGGVAYRRVRSPGDLAPISSDVLTRSVIRVRAGLTESAPASDTITQRKFTGTRPLSESAPASDTLARTLIVTRRMNEYLGGTPDYPVTTPRTITGIVTNNGLPVSGASCVLLRDSDRFRVPGAYTTGVDGRYTFTRDKDDPNTYHVEVYVGGTLHGLTDLGLVPS